MDAYSRPAKTLARVRDHYLDWTQAIRSGARSGSDFSYGGALTQIPLLGTIAIRLAGTKLEWDASQARFANSREANQLVAPEYRKGWKL